MLQLRHALGWGQAKIAKVMGVYTTTVQHLENGMVTLPNLTTIRKIKKMESAYEDILKVYKKAPVRYNRLRRRKGDGVQLLPIQVRRPQDLEALENMGTGTDTMFFGRNSRRRVREAGVPVRRKALSIRRGKAISRAVRAKMLTGWNPFSNNRKVQPGQPNGDGEGEK